MSDYKEFILLLAALVASVFFVRDYFATKRDVRILECREEAEITLMQSKDKSRETREQLLRAKDALLTGQKATIKATPHPGLVQSANAASASRSEFEIQVKELEDELSVQKAIQRQLQERLRPNTCEAVVDAQNQSLTPSGAGEKK